jgi:hypothetical protein
MGVIIRKTAATEDIIADLRVTLANARARSGPWAALAEAQIATAVALIDSTEARMAQAQDHADPLVAALDAKHEEADRLLERIWDEIWNEVGRPAADPALATLFPGGVSYYADGDVEAQPDRMELLAALLESNAHPRLAPVTSTSLAKRIYASATTLRSAVNAARGPSARVGLLQRVRRAIAATALKALANLKRSYKIEGFSESDIHTVIPDRDAARRAAPTTQPPPGAAA